jgi:phosphate uptake regulator
VEFRKIQRTSGGTFLYVFLKIGLSEKLGIIPIDCLDYRLAASLVESIGDQAASIGETTIKLAG